MRAHAQCTVLSAHCSLLSAHCSVLSAQCSLLSAHCSLLIAHANISILSSIKLFCAVMPKTMSDKDMELVKSDKCNIPQRRNSVAGTIDKLGGRISTKISDNDKMNKILKELEEKNERQKENKLILQRIEEKVD